MENKSKILLALLFGAAAGAVLGVLFAPDSGENTRSKVKKWAEDMEDDLNAVYEDAKEKMTEIKSKAKSKAEEWAGKTRETAEHLKNDAN